MSDSLSRYYDLERQAMVYEHNGRRLEVSDAELVQMGRRSSDLTGRAAVRELQRRVEAWLADER